MLVWFKAALAAITVLSLPIGISIAAAGGGNEALGVLGGLAIFGGVLALFVSWIIALVWVYTMWDSLPYELRANYKRVHSPTSSTLYLLIPYFNIYWMFVMNIDLIRAINTGAERMNTRRVAEGWGIICPLMHFLPCANVVVAPITWTLLMFQVQGAKDELIAALHAQNYSNPQQY